MLGAPVLSAPIENFPIIAIICRKVRVFNISVFSTLTPIVFHKTPAFERLSVPIRQVR